MNGKNGQKMKVVETFVDMSGGEMNIQFVMVLENVYLLKGHMQIKPSDQGVKSCKKCVVDDRNNHVRSTRTICQ